MTSHHIDLSNEIRLCSEDRDPFNAKLKKQTKVTCPAYYQVYTYRPTWVSPK